MDTPDYAALCASERFRISYRDSTYKVSIPNYDGGEVVTAEAFDRLQALCAQMAAAIEVTLNHEDKAAEALKADGVACPELLWMPSLRAAITAYRTLSPDPVYAEAKNLRDALQNMLGVYDTPLSRRQFPPDDFMNEAISTARETANRARGEG